jgi:hypothetical protein
MRLRKAVSWGDLSEECTSTIPVVILDGLDELIQATGITQSSYLTEVKRFQQEEQDVGRAVAVIVTSRTVVLDRARVPDGCPLLKLENFDDQQLESWVATWNYANEEMPNFTALDTSQLTPYGELAHQPLLLTMIGIHAAGRRDSNRDTLGFSSSELYKGLMDDSIRRQVVDKPEAPPSEEELPVLLAQRRHLLGAAAFAMFNRGHQDVSENELNQDCDALFGPADTGVVKGPGMPITRADRIISDFFFVHVAGSDMVTSGETENQVAAARRSYEFMHSTFGEFLIAERTLEILNVLGESMALTEADPSMRGAFGIGPVQALLCHRPLLNRQEILTFVHEILSREYSYERRTKVLRLLRWLIQTARESFSGEFNNYDPSPRDLVARLACYTLNLITLALCVSDGAVDLNALVPKAAEPLSWWRSTVRLWRAGLEPEGWAAALSTIGVTRNRESIQVIRNGRANDQAGISDEVAEKGLLMISG